MEWRQRLDTQRGAVFATELKNNSCKLSKWTVTSLLSGSSSLRLGYVCIHVNLYCHCPFITLHLLLCEVFKCIRILQGQLCFA